MNKNSIPLGIAAIALIVSIFAFLKPATIETQTPPFGAASGPNHQNDEEFFGVTHLYNWIFGNKTQTFVNLTDHTALTGDQVCQSSNFLLNSSGSNMTVSFPSVTSTIQKCLQYVGDSKIITFYNATSGANTVTLATSTGGTTGYLVIKSSSTIPVTLSAGTLARVQLVVVSSTPQIQFIYERFYAPN